MNRNNEIAKLVRRLKRLGIEIELFGNYPWIYLDKVNGNKVKEKFQSDWGFTIALYYAKSTDTEILLTDISKIFDIIRKYK